jgi:hypothetical protein
MVLVPAGTFMMVSPDSEPGRYEGEGPQARDHSQIRRGEVRRQERSMGGVCFS